MASFERLRGLGEIKFTKITNDLMRGVPAMTLARTVQQEWGDFQDVAEKTLTQQLNRMRLQMTEGAFGKDIATEVQKIAIVKGAMKSPVIDILDGTRFDCLLELERLARLQKRRVERLAEREQGMPMPMTPLNAVINDYKQLLIDIQEVRFKLGADEFKGAIPGVRGVSASVIMPDGMIIQKQVYEAVDVVERIFDKRGIPSANDLSA